MSKTKQFCETSSISKLTTSETKQLCETSFKNGKLNAERPRANAFCFAIFPFHLFKVLRLPRKSEARSSAAPVTQKHLKQTWRLKIFYAPKCNPSQEISALTGPDLLTSLIKMSLVLCLPGERHLCRSSSNVPRLPSFLEMLQKPSRFFSLLTRCKNPLPLPHKTTLQRLKVAQTCGAFGILTSECASRHNAVRFFNISTSKNGPTLRCFVHFDFEICCAPQRRALFHVSIPNSAPKLTCFVHFDFKTHFAPQRRAIFYLSSGQMAPHPPL